MLTKFPRKFPFKFSYLISIGEPFKSIIFNVIKIILDKIINEKSSEDLSKKEQLNSNSLEDVKNYNELLNNFNKQIEVAIYSLEDKIVEECIQYYEELIFLITTIESSKGINLQSEKIELEIERLRLDIRGNLATSIYRNFSLDNNNLKLILKLPPSQIKKQKIQNFKEDLIKQILQDFIKDIKISIYDLSELISEQLMMLISDIRKNNEDLLSELTLLENAKNSQKNINNTIILAEEKKILCNKILNILRM